MMRFSGVEHAEDKLLRGVREAKRLGRKDYGIAVVAQCCGRDANRCGGRA
jgi:hypothetical protein